jgi:hypothetical protein
MERSLCGTIAGTLSSLGGLLLIAGASNQPGSLGAHHNG